MSLNYQKDLGSMEELAQANSQANKELLLVRNKIYETIIKCGQQTEKLKQQVRDLKKENKLLKEGRELKT